MKKVVALIAALVMCMALGAGAENDAPAMEIDEYDNDTLVQKGRQLPVMVAQDDAEDDGLEDAYDNETVARRTLTVPVVTAQADEGGDGEDGSSEDDGDDDGEETARLETLWRA